MKSSQVPTHLTVKQFADKHPAYTVGGLRFHIFHAHENGLDEAEAILRLGRKVLIDEARFFTWVESQNRHQRAA